MKKLLIIGGGVSGLSAGIHGRLLGFDTTIVEKNATPGGVSAVWERQGYHLDASMHWLTGTQPGNDTYEMWKTLGVLGDHVEMVPNKSQGVFEYGGQSFTVYADLKKLEAELIRVAPEDTKAIRQLIRDIRAVGGMDMPAKCPVEFLPPKEKLKLLLPMIRMGMQVKNRITMANEEYAKSFRSPLLRRYFTVWPQGQEQHMGYLFKMAMMCRGNANYPKGGSGRFIRNMRERYQELGGTLITRKEATSIEVEEGRLSCVRFADGDTMTADYLLCACDPHITLEKLLGGKYPVPEFTHRYENREHYYLNSSCIAFFGLDLPVGEVEEGINFEGEPLTVGKSTVERFSLRSFAMEPDFAPQGQTLLSMDMIQRDDDFLMWQDLYENDRAAYQQKKQWVAAQLEKRILTRFPHWEGHLRLVDTLTPMTYYRYTGAYHGAWMAFRSTAEGKRMTHTGCIPGLSNIRLTGQWLQPSGGLPVAAAMSKFSVQRIAKEEGMEFLVK